MWCPLHRHDQFSSWDGFGRASDAVKYAKEIGITALGLTNHGNTSGLIEHYVACKEAGIHPVLGVEAYFQPTFNKETPQYHLTVLVENIAGYKNMNRMLTEAAEKQFYRRPVIDLPMMKKYGEGLIILSGCVGGYLARTILRGEMDAVNRYVEGMKRVFGDRFYLEVQPHSDMGVVERQKSVNAVILELGKTYGIDVVMTSDSHYVRQEDYAAYLTMYRVGNKEPTADYSTLYIATEKEMARRWKEMMGEDGQALLDNSQKVAERCQVELLFGEMVPKLEWGEPAEKKLTKLAMDGLKRLRKTDKPYIQRMKHEIGVVKDKGYVDYFLLVHDVVEYARNKGIAALARGSVCGSLLAYALGFTAVDPLVLDTNFERFLRPNKFTQPDIDIDFDSDRRDEVIEYLVNKYDGKAARISTFGLYKTKNLCNDLIRVMKVEEKDAEFIKSRLEKEVGDAPQISFADLVRHRDILRFSLSHPGFLEYFCKLYGQVRFIGRHAAGAALASDDIGQYVALQRVHDVLQTSYDMDGLVNLGILKMDCLGLATLSHRDEIERMTGTKFEYWMLNDKDIYAAFARGETEGVFQFESHGSKDILSKVQPENIQELIACNALNRPAPIQLGVLDEYVRGKNGNLDVSTPWYEYTSDSFGVIIYQEQIIRLCHEMAKLDWELTDKILKAVSKKDITVEMEEKFVHGAVENTNMDEDEARELFRKMSLYLFNKNHGAGYTLLSFYMMWLKKNFPLEFWYSVIRHEPHEKKREEYKSNAVKDDVVFLPPHINGGAYDSIVEFDGERVVQEGLLGLKGVGEITAKEIERCGPFTSEEDLLEKVEKRHCNKSVVEILRKNGSVEFNEKRRLRDISIYNCKFARRSSWKAG